MEKVFKKGMFETRDEFLDAVDNLKYHEQMDGVTFDIGKAWLRESECQKWYLTCECFDKIITLGDFRFMWRFAEIVWALWSGEKFVIEFDKNDSTRGYLFEANSYMHANQKIKMLSMEDGLYDINN